jgi:hypothetical protein
VQQSSSPAAARNATAHNKIDLLRLMGVKRAPGLPFSFIPPVAPTVSATKADFLLTDVDGDNQADPGDTLKYTVSINASGEDATGVTFTDTVDPNTAFVPGSLRATPVAVDDTYAATGNIRITVAAPGVLGNDFVGVPSATITGAPSTSTNGGDVTLNADGSFTYNPPAGFEGADTFSYTLTNSAGSNPATVTINVSGMIWFINNTASCPCDGRLTNPFNTLASFQAVNNGVGNHPAANDNIFVYESAIDYVGPVTLLNGQRFLGQDSTASLSAMTGLTPPAGSDPLPATNSGNGTIVNITSGNAITVGSGNTLRGFTGGDSTTDITGSGFGTLTISDVTLNGSGQALNLTTGTLAATFGSISSTNSATTGISLTSVAGSLTSPTTTITNPTGIGISVGTSSATLNFGATNSSLSGGTGVSLLTNTGAITFSSLDISPDANQRGLLATDNSNTITSTSGAISASNAVAVEITRASGTTPLSMSLTSISANGGANGIVLTNTSGSLTVNGTGTTDGSGGTVQNITTRGANINNATNITFKNMNFTSANSTVDGGGAGVCDDLNIAGCNAAIYLSSVAGATLDNLNITGTMVENGINALNVSNFKLDNSLLEGCGDGLNESCVEAQNLSGTSTVNGTEIRFSETNSFDVVNTDTNWNLTIDGSTFRDTQTTSSGGPTNLNGEGGLQFRAFSTAAGAPTTTINVLNSSFLRLRTQGIQAFAADDAVMNIDITGCTIDSQADIGTGIDLNSNNTATVNFNITGNPTIQSRGGAAVNITSFLASHTEGRLNNNSDIEVLGGAGIPVRVLGQDTSTLVIQIDGNTISNVNGTDSTAIDVTSRFQTTRVDAVITNNVVSVRPAGIAAINLTSGASSAGESTILCGDVANNNAANAAAVAARAFRVRVSDVSNLNRLFLEGFVEAGTATQDTEATWNARSNTPVSAGGGEVTASLTGTAVGPLAPPGGQCIDVSTPADFAMAPVDNNQSAAAFMPDSESTSARSQQSADSNSKRDTASTLEAFLGEAKNGDNSAKLSASQLNLMIPAAIERWRASGLSYEDLARLQAMTFEIADLPGGQLSSATSTSVKIDETAAGYGWYLDISPMEDSEFDVSVTGRELQTTEFSPAHGHMDLLTVVMRGLGQALLQGKKTPEQLRPLMENTLSPAVRRLPDSRNIGATKSQARVSGKGGSASERTLVSNKRPSSTSAASMRKAESNPAANKVQSSRLMNHVSRNRTTATTLSSALADVMLSIGTLPAGESVTITFNVTVDDPFTGGLPQVSNQGTVSGSNFADVLTDDPSVGGAADPTVTPIDLPQVSVAVSPASVAEDGATNLVYTFTRTGSTANAMTVNFNVGGTASFTEPDYTQTGAATFTATNGTVVIPSGSSTATVTVDPSADTTVEPDQTVDLTVTSGTGYTVGSPSSASGTITNDDTDVSLAVSPASVTEDGATNLVYTFTRTGVTTNSLTVNFSVGGTADFGASPNDYTQTGATTFTSTTGSVTFTAGSPTASVTVDPEADSTVESDETVILTLTSGGGYNVVSPSMATGTITNDDADVSVTVSPSSVAEDGATNLVYTFVRTGFTGGALTVNFTVGGTADFGASPNDYTQTGATTFTSTTGSVTFGAGNSIASVTIDPEADTTAESDETVIITLAAGAGYNVVSPNSATGTILNDDTIVSVAVSPSSSAEGGANLVYTFTRTGPTTSALTVNFSVGGSASFPADYSQSGAATFTPPTATVNFGVGSSTATVTVTPLSDCEVEGNETVVFTVQPGAGYGVGSPSTATGTIVNTPDSTAPTITLIPNVNMVLWPPNHDYTSVAVTDFVASASDDCDPTVNVNSVYILKITSDEVEDGAADGNTLNDIVIGATCKTAQLRAERSGSGDGRVYTITFKVKDSSGNFTTATVKVTVPLTPGNPAVDSGPVYIVNSSCP